MTMQNTDWNKRHFTLLWTPYH